MPTNLEKLQNLSATNRLSQIRKNLRNSSYIIKDMALEGQITLFYAQANTGKTLLFLHFLIEAINDGRLKGSDLIYINADDNYRGLVEKATIAHQYGFYMINPSEAGTTPTDILSLLFEVGKDKNLRSKVIIMDTLKKFADMMSKKGQSNLYDLLRDLCIKGATVIIAGHTNKHLNHNGELVYEGTGDTLNDIDCAYSINKMSAPDDPQQVVEFRNKKSRGNNISKVSYQYTKSSGSSYQSMINSVSQLSNGQATSIAASTQQTGLVASYVKEIAFIKPLLAKSSLNQSQILTALKNETDPFKPSRRCIDKALKDLNGIEWQSAKGKNNKIIFSLIP